MLEPLKHVLSQQRIILCSNSPRRKELLNQIGLKFEVVPSTFEENLDKSSFNHPSSYVKENAKQKAIDVWKRLSVDQNNHPDLLISADTIVTMDNKIYEKPKDEEDAIDMLSTLSGNKHTVFTGVALLTKSQSSSSESNESNYKVTTFHEGTDVFVAQLTPEIIRSYVNTKEPLDKAGAYGIQGIGSTLIESIKGCYFNVMGLPVYSLSKELYHIYTD